MKIKQWKTKIIGLSIAMIILGIILVFIGLNMVDFNLRALETGKWYQIFHLYI